MTNIDVDKSIKMFSELPQLRYNDILNTLIYKKIDLELVLIDSLSELFNLIFGSNFFC